jgi:anti-anti-sigma factor
MESTDVVIRRDGTTIVAVVLLRRVTGTPAEDGMWQKIAALLGPVNNGALVLECSQVQYITSLGVGRLVTLAKQSREAHNRLVVRGLCPSLWQLFRILRLDMLLEIESDPAPGGGGPG